MVDPSSRLAIRVRGGWQGTNRLHALAPLPGPIDCSSRVAPVGRTRLHGLPHAVAVAVAGDGDGVSAIVREVDPEVIAEQACCIHQREGS